MKHDTESPSLSSQALPPGTRVEEFVIERVLGSGGFGITYLALDTHLDRPVVIKENLPAQFCFRDPSSLTVAPRHTHGDDVDNFQWSLDNFSRESAILASLDHPGIVRVLRSFQAFGTAYFVMPFVEGETLDEVAKQRQARDRIFSEQELSAMLDRILDALGHLHGKGIYHRDIKPGNILITQEGLPVLIDFGSARQRLSERSMTVVESAGYTPFEQLQTRGNVGPWSDLYSLGATLVKVITGEIAPKANDRAFDDPWVPLAGREHLKGRYSETFLSGIDRALRLPVEERWQTAEDWKQALISGNMPELGRQTRIPTAASGKQRSNKSHISAVLAMATVLLLGFGVWWMQGGQGVSSPKPILFGALVLTSEPSPAKVLDASGQELGVTPLELRDLPGGQTWEGTMEKPGYLPSVVRENVPVGESRLVPPVKLQPQPQKVIVTSEPTGAEVVEGETVLGVTPWESNPREVGVEVAVTLRLEGYVDEAVGGKVDLGSTLMLQKRLQPLPQKVTVTSQPSGAEVMEGGKVLGVTPLDLPEVPPGTKISYQLKLDGYEAIDVTGEVPLGKPLELAGVLEVLPQRAFEGAKAGEEQELEIAPGVKMTFCWCPPGDFLKGSSSSEADRLGDEEQVKVTLNKGFWIGKTEVTQAQWQAVMGTNPSEYKGKNLPVDTVSYNDAKDFIEKLNSRSDISHGWKMVLPTEAQWEYAARAGQSSIYSGGDSIDLVAWYKENSSKTNHAGNKKSNAWGIHDMSGNVWEWCQPASSYEFSIRGGAWFNDARGCRVAGRNNIDPEEPSNGIGLRVVRISVPVDKPSATKNASTFSEVPSHFHGAWTSHPNGSGFDEDDGHLLVEARNIRGWEWSGDVVSVKSIGPRAIVVKSKGYNEGEECFSEISLELSVDGSVLSSKHEGEEKWSKLNRAREDLMPNDNIEKTHEITNFSGCWYSEKLNAGPGRDEWTEVMLDIKQNGDQISGVYSIGYFVGGEVQSEDGNQNPFIGKVEGVTATIKFDPENFSPGFEENVKYRDPAGGKSPGRADFTMSGKSLIVNLKEREFIEGIGGKITFKKFE
jgi:serine/threonine protein kinase